MNRRNVLFGMAAALAIFALSSAAYAGAFEGGRHKRGMGMDFKGLQVLLALKLTEPQQVEISRILAKYETEGKSLKGNLRDSRQKLGEVLREEPFTEDKARKAFRESSAAREEMFVLRAKMMSELKGVLTPEQMAKVNEHRDHRSEKIKHRKAK